MALLEGSSGRMIYWARFTCDPDNDSKIDAQMADKGNTIKMIRNHAPGFPSTTDQRVDRGDGFCSL